MSSEAVPGSKATAAAAGAATDTASREDDKTETKAVKGEDKVCPLPMQFINLALFWCVQRPCMRQP